MSICSTSPKSAGGITPRGETADGPIILKTIQTCAAEVESCIKTLKRDPVIMAALIRRGNRDFLESRFWESHKREMIRRGLEKRAR